MSVSELRWQYFTSITVQFILLKLFFRKKKKKKEYLLIWDTAEIVCNIILVFPSAVMHSQKAVQQKKNNNIMLVELILSRCSISCMTVSEQNWPHSIQNLLLTAKPHLMYISVNRPTLFSFLFCVIIFTFHLHDILSKELYASKTQTSNTISTPATSNESRKIFPIKGPGGIIAKVDGEKKKKSLQPFLFCNVMEKMLQGTVAKTSGT